MATRRCAGVGRGRGVNSKDAATACCETLGMDPRYISGKPDWSLAPTG